MEDSTYGWGRALAAGAVGAAALTSVHQLARLVTDVAPRMDVVGGRAIAKGVRAAGGNPPAGNRLLNWALVGDLISNASYYALIPYGREPHVWRRATALGLAAGAGALVLPRPMGLGDPPYSENRANQVMTVAWYLLGALATAAASRTALLRPRSSMGAAHGGRPEEPVKKCGMSVTGQRRRRSTSGCGASAYARKNAPPALA